jgi:cytoskeletal protein RodZ
VIRNFIIALLVVLVIIVGYLVWTRTRGNVFGDGAITEQNTSSSNEQASMNSGTTTDLDGNAARPNTSRSDDPGTINTVPVGSTGTQNSTPTMGTPMANNTPAPAPSPVSAPGGLTARAPVLGPAAPPPTTDSIAPNPPNHVAFGGTGKYMWYRQGDLTWRVNSDTGASCIAFATMQQWARPVVYQNGCDNRRG